MVYWQARALELVSPGADLAQWLRSVLAELNTKFASWKVPDEGDDPYGCADPQLVAALEIIAAMFPDEKEN